MSAEPREPVIRLDRRRFLQVLAGTTLANLPGTVGSTLMGDQINAVFSAERDVNAIAIVAVVLMVATMAYASRRLWKKMQPLIAA